jgi:hypothetical protein
MSLQDRVAKSHRESYVSLIPVFGEPETFQNDLAAILQQHGARYEVVSRGTSTSCDQLREQKIPAGEEHRATLYYVSFRHPIQAHTFTMNVNNDPSIPYTAVVSSNPIGIGRLQIIRKLPYS